MSRVELLSHSIFEKPFMDSKIRTRSVTMKEKILGHLIGPLGLIFVVNTIAGLVEKFFTQQAGAMYGTANVDMIMTLGSRYEVVMTMAKVLATLMGLLIGWLVQHTVSRQGRFRPWHLIFGFMSIIIGCLIFLFPGNNGMGGNYWYYFFFLVVCYQTVGSTYFYVFRDNIVSVSTRDPQAKANLKFIRHLSWTLVSGIVVGMVINMMVLPMWLDHDITGYPKLMITLSIIAIPLLFIEYYYTRERVIEDVAATVGEERENSIPFCDQVRALLSNRYYVLFFIMMTVGSIVDNFKGGNVQYFYIKYILGGETNPMMYSLYQVVTGVPLGIGAFLIYPLSKKFGIRNVCLAGYSIALVSGIIGYLNATNLPIAMAAGFCRQLGMLPNAYIFGALLCYAFDSVEFKSGFRLEGLLGASVFTALQQIVTAPFAGGFESTILGMGFVDVQGVTPSDEVRSFFIFAFYVVDILMCIIYIIILPFFDVEKKLPEINKEILERKKEAVLARGEEWVDPEELERREQEQLEQEAEAERIADLKERCAKKGLDFEVENAKYMERKTAKEAKHRQ
jgi:GPH family glycoside/pentoside/hexuronide:cation symporter